jgi:hypothetical protein
MAFKVEYIYKSNFIFVVDVRFPFFNIGGGKCLTSSPLNPHCCQRPCAHINEAEVPVNSDIRQGCRKIDADSK